MRVISGKYRGLVLAEFEGDDIRPTADRVKESLFNILAPRIRGAEALDLFCGSGSLGIECISRGAKSVDFNDGAPSSIEVLGKNLAKLKGENNYTVTNSDFRAFLRAAKKPYDIIFVDPPYRCEYGVSVFQTIAERNLLKEGGVIVYERDIKFYEKVDGIEPFDERKYGRTYLTFLRAEQKA